MIVAASPHQISGKVRQWHAREGSHKKTLERGTLLLASRMPSCCIGFGFLSVGSRFSRFHGGFLSGVALDISLTIIPAIRTTACFRQAELPYLPSMPSHLSSLLLCYCM